MKHITWSITSIAILTLFLSVFPIRDAHAYIDPGTGSYIFQVIVAGLLGAGFVVKMFWRNIKTFLTDLFSKFTK